MEKVIKVWLKYYPVYLSGLWGTLWISAVTVFLGVQIFPNELLGSAQKAIELTQTL